MSDFNKAAKAEEAKKLLAGIVKHQRESENRLANLDDQVSDLKKAQRLLIESRETETKAFVASNDTGLKKFVREDGSLQMTSETKNKPYFNQGIMAIEEKGLLDAEQFEGEWHQELCRLAAERATVRSMMKQPHTPKSDMKLFKHIQRAPAFIRDQVTKAFTDTAGSGGDWIPDQFSTDLWQTFEISRSLRSLLPTVQMDRETLIVPKLVRGGRPYLKGKLTDNLPSYAASTVETAQKTIRAAGFATLYNIDDAAAEDSAISILPAMQRQIVSDLEDAFEDCMLNGDTTSTHEDAIASWNLRSRWGSSGLGGSDDHRRGFKGWRRLAFDKSSTKDYGGTAPTFATFMDAVALSGELGVGNRVLVVSPEVLISTFLQMTQVATVDQYGPAATILTGELGQIMGLPIVLSRFMGADLHTNGKFTGANTTSGFIIYNQASYNQYVRRQITVETDKNIASGAIQLVSTMRACMDSPDADATKNVVYGFNCPIS